MGAVYTKRTGELSRAILPDKVPACVHWFVQEVMFVPVVLVLLLCPRRKRKTKGMLCPV